MMDYSSYFRLEVVELVGTKEFLTMTVEELKVLGKPFVFERIKSIPLDLLRGCIIERMDIETDREAMKLYELCYIDYYPTLLSFPNGNNHILLHPYDEFVSKIDDMMNKDMENFGLVSYSFKTNKYGRKNR